MAVAGKWKAFELAKFRMWDGTFDLDDTTNWKLAWLLSTSNANNLAVGTAVYGDLTNEVANAFGYLTGGVAMTGITMTRSGGTMTFDAADLAPAWLCAGGPLAGRFFVIYKNATVNGIVKPLLAICLCDATPADVSQIDGNPVNINFHAAGIITLGGAAVD